MIFDPSGTLMCGLLGAVSAAETAPRGAVSAARTSTTSSGVDLGLGFGAGVRPAVGGALADAGERAERWDLVVDATVGEVLEQGVELVVGDLVAVAVVHLQGRGLRAGRDALDVLEREHTVVGGRSGADAETLFGVLEQLPGPEQLAGDVGADVDAIAPDGLELEHLVERGRAVDLGRLEAEELGDVAHRLFADPAVLLLGEVEQRDQRRLRAWVAADDLLGHRDVGVAQSAHSRTAPLNPLVLVSELARFGPVPSL